MESKNTLSIQNVTKKFYTDQGTVHALDNFSLDIKEGEFLVIVGPSGCGKSTLISIVAGLLGMDEGQVVINGQKVNGPFTDVGIVFQNHVLLDWLSVLNNVLFQITMRRLPRKEYEPRAMELLKMVALDGFEKSFPYELSGGMKQRCSLCRAILHDPPLLLMDEPFGALDALTREQLCIDLEKIWLGTRKTVVFITHDVQEAVQLADRIIVMTPRPGRIYKELIVDTPRPRYERALADDKFYHLVEEIKQSFIKQGVIKR
jgi:NitT/TauT family transport system ATP-binding protein